MDSTPRTNKSLESLPSDNRLWSPFSIFILGTIFAALNWWRMGKIRKAIIFIGLTIISELITYWLITDKYRIQLEIVEKYSLIFLAIPIIWYLLFRALIAEIMANDINNFLNTTQKTNPVNWKIVLIFELCIICFYTFGMMGMNSIFSDTKYCRIPKLIDLIYNFQLYNSTVLEKEVINHYDINCKYYWVIEHGISNDTKSAKQYLDLGRINDNTHMTIYHKISANKIENNSKSIQEIDPSFVDISENINITAKNVDNLYSKCYQIEDSIITCNLQFTLGNKTNNLIIISNRFRIEEINQIIEEIIEIIDQKVKNYG
jgi:hypothetical protein